MDGDDYIFLTGLKKMGQPLMKKKYSVIAECIFLPIKYREKWKLL